MRLGDWDCPAPGCAARHALVRAPWVCEGPRPRCSRCGGPLRLVRLVRVLDEAAQVDYLKLISDGCNYLGITTEQRKAMFVKHGGDERLVYAEIKRLADGGR